MAKPESNYLGRELPTLTRTWSLDVFQQRHAALMKSMALPATGGPRSNLHTDEKAAKAQGLPGVVGAGPQVIAQVQRVMMKEFGVGWIQGGKMDLKMIKSIVPGDETTVHARITALRLEQDADGQERTRAECSVQVMNQNRVPVLVGSTSALLPG